MTSKAIWRYCRNDYLIEEQILRKDRNAVTEHIAWSGFWEAAGQSASAGTATLRLTPKANIQGINDCIQAPDAPIIITPEEWDGVGLYGRIKMTPSIKLNGCGEWAEEAPDAVMKLTPTVGPCAMSGYAWGQIKLEGALHWAPPLPLLIYNGSVFRRCPSDRLESWMLLRVNNPPGNPQQKVVAEGFFEYGLLEQTALAYLHITGDAIVQGINAQEYVEPAIVVLTGSALAMVGPAPIEGEIYMVPLTPTVRHFLAPSEEDVDTGLPALCTNIEITQSLQNKIALGTFDFEEATTGGYYSGIYFKDVVVSLPDHNSSLHPVFVGFFHSDDANYGAADDRESFPAYDPIWYLGMQNLNEADRMILTTTSQSTQTRHQEYFFFAELQNGWPKVGDIIRGATSGDFGKIIEVHNYGTPYFVVENPQGGHLEDEFMVFFEDDELLQVDDVSLCYADGHSLDVTGTISTDPRTIGEWVAAVLGGTNWQEETGIEPFNIIDPGVTPVDFIFDENQSIEGALERVAKRMSYIFVGKPRGNPGTAIFSGYFIPQGDIDTQLGLPGTASFAAGNEYVQRPITMSLKGDRKYNRVTVKCQGFDLKWYKCTIGGDEKPCIDFFEINPDIASQSECNTRGADVYAYYRKMISTWNMTILKRQDLQYLQLVGFSGYGIEIPDGTYRIVAIKRRYAEGGTINQVDISVVLNADFALYLNLSRVFTDSANEMMAIAKSELLKMGATETGVATSVTAGKVVLTTSDGQTKTGAEGNAETEE